MKINSMLLHGGLCTCVKDDLMNGVFDGDEPRDLTNRYASVGYKNYTSDEKINIVSIEDIIIQCLLEYINEYKQKEEEKCLLKIKSRPELIESSRHTD